MLLAKQLYFYSGTILTINTDGVKTDYADVVKHVYDPFESLLVKGKSVRSVAIQDYGLTVGYFSKVMPDDLDTYSVYDPLHFEILGTHDALLYIFPGGNIQPFEGCMIRIREVIPMGLSEYSDYHVKQMRMMKDWMQDTHPENLRRIGMEHYGCDE